jgi:hypothetical protein
MCNERDMMNRNLSLDIPTTPESGVPLSVSGDRYRYSIEYQSTVLEFGVERFFRKLQVEVFKKHMRR